MTTNFTTRPELDGSFGMVASTHWLASSAAMGVLERGGNAADAAVCGGFVLQVVEPHLNGPGGEVPILVHDVSADAGEPVSVICGQGVAPAAASPGRFADLGLDLIPATGLLPAVVPGAFGAWLMLLRDHGTMALSDVLAPALHYAEHGYPLLPRIAQAMATVRDLFRDEWPSSAEIYCAGSAPPAPGSVFRNPILAETYRRILREADGRGAAREAQIEAARRAWYEGFVAERIDAFYRSAELIDVTGRRHGGLLTGEDMARWTATRERCVTLDYHGLTVAKCGPWSQGPVMLQQLALLRDMPLAGMAPDGAEFVHAVVEAAKLAFADREAWYGDGTPDALIDALLSPAYAAERAALIGTEAEASLNPGAPLGGTPRMPTHRLASASSTDVAALLGAGEPTTARDGEPSTDRDGALRGDTCHIDVVDRWGNMVAATPSGGWFQSSPVVPGLGFPISTRAQMFWLEEGLASTLAPGRRPRTTLTPSMASRDGEPYLAWGTPGGDQQDQWSLTFLLRHLHHGMNLQEAIDAPSFHSEHWQSSFWPREARPNRLVVEGRMPGATVDSLRARGHDVEVGGAWSEGRLSACSQTHEGGHLRLRAGANPRGMQGYAVGR